MSYWASATTSSTDVIPPPKISGAGSSFFATSLARSISISGCTRSMHDPHGSFSARSISPTIASVEPDVIAFLIERYEAPFPASAIEGMARAAAKATAIRAPEWME